MKIRTNRLGEIRESKTCGPMEIVEYNGCENIKVRFKTGNVVLTRYDSFKNGFVKDLLCPTVFNIGFFGIGKHKGSVKDKSTKIYNTWNSMLARCYDPYIINRLSTYRDVIVCKKWLNFQNFAEWMTQNYYEIPNEVTNLDKDLMRAGNKIYHPKLCSFVPQSINTLIAGNTSKKSNLPIGVSIGKNKFTARIKINGKLIPLGLYTTPEEAFFVYKTEKEKQIKIKANKFKDVLHPRVYKYLMNYKVPLDKRVA